MNQSHLLAQLSRTGSATPSDTSGVDARLAALGSRPSAEGSGDALRQGNEPHGNSDGSSSAAPPGQPDEEAGAPATPAPIAPPGAEKGRGIDAVAAVAGEASPSDAAAQVASPPIEHVAEAAGQAEVSGVEESDGHFTSTSQSTDGVLVRRDSRGHLSKSLSSTRVSALLTTVAGSHPAFSVPPRALVHRCQICNRQQWARAVCAGRRHSPTSPQGMPFAVVNMGLLQGAQAVAAENVQVFDRTESPRATGSSRPGSGGSSRPGNGSNAGAESRLAASSSSRSLVSCRPLSFHCCQQKSSQDESVALVDRIAKVTWQVHNMSGGRLQSALHRVCRGRACIWRISRQQCAHDPLRAMRTAAVGACGLGSRGWRGTWSSGRWCRTAPSSASTAWRT